MNTVNVIEKIHGNINKLVAFADNTYGNAKAETLFAKLVKEHNPVETDLFQYTAEDIEQMLEDGGYDDQCGYELNLVHSSCEDIPPYLNDSIQFPRLIAELETTGAFTNDVIFKLMDEMEMSENEVTDLIDRAQAYWDEIKSNVLKGKYPN